MTANPLLWLIRELFKACDTRVVLGDTRFTDFSDSPLPEPILGLSLVRALNDFSQ